jgi:hypothetical protein
MSDSLFRHNRVSSNYSHINNWFPIKERKAALKTRIGLKYFKLNIIL